MAARDLPSPRAPLPHVINSLDGVLLTTSSSVLIFCVYGPLLSTAYGPLTPNGLSLTTFDGLVLTTSSSIPLGLRTTSLDGLSLTASSWSMDYLATFNKSKYRYTQLDKSPDERWAERVWVLIQTRREPELVMPFQVRREAEWNEGEGNIPKVLNVDGLVTWIRGTCEEADGGPGHARGQRVIWFGAEVCIAMVWCEQQYEE
ncbi:uncharacterized protein EI90DRAFT_3292570 [Cantharellus anzutake]|uniref:uncharacterized protein n=1 Tax=Cantharellus anzutake TaxID=1750568 RepID=UPI0019034022|nr:uncharacterized protein EI90DRAFT_3292570 [Cantharellus anzutake]KAF8321986.1 hypothetical protein EI90DRAFT_3292570 [Cantharellus anzutake]